MTVKNEFIDRGYEMYPEAALAVSTFQAELIARLKSALDARHAWGPFEINTPRSGSGGDLEVGWWISVSRTGSIGGEKAAIEAGYLWNPPFDGGKPVLFSKFLGNPVRLRQFQYDGSVAEVKAFTAWGHTTLTSPMPKDLDPRRLINVQLDILVQVMGQK